MMAFQSDNQLLGRLMFSTLLFLLSTTVTQATCPNGWVSYDESCYHFLYTSRGINYNNARVYCQHLGGDLAVISTPNENIQLTSIIKTFGDEIDVANGPWFAWIGFRNSEESWNWINTGEISTYTNWENGYPNAGSDPSKCAGVSVVGISAGVWLDLDCDVTYFVKYALCEIPGTSVRLVDGDSGASGRLEVKINAHWGTVCDDYWNINNSNVACRQLGFPSSVLHASNTRDRPGSGDILLDDVQCNGQERYITSCKHNAYGISNCGHVEDIQITCSPEKIEGINVPKWYTELTVKQCTDWDTHCNGDCYSACGKPVLLTLIGNNDKAIRVICMDTKLSKLNEYVPNTFTLNTMTIFTQSAVIDDNPGVEYMVTLVTRRLQVNDTTWLSVDPITNCYTFSTMVHDDIEFYKITHASYNVIIFAESLKIPDQRCVQSLEVPERDFPLIPSEYFSMSTTCMGILQLGIVQTSRCVNHAVEDATTFILKGKQINELKEMARNLKIKQEIETNQYIFVPALSNSAYASILNTYVIDFELLEDELSNFDFEVSTVEDRKEMLELMYANARDTLGARQTELNDGIYELDVSQQTITLLQASFAKQQVKLAKQQKKFEKDAKVYAALQSVKAFFGLVSAIAGIASGKSTDDNTKVINSAGKLLTGIGDLISLIFDLIKIFNAISKVDGHIKGAEELTPDEYKKYTDTVSEFANLPVQAASWQSLENTADSLLSQGAVTQIVSAGEYRRTISDVADYGRALTEEIIRHTQLQLQKLEDTAWLQVSSNEVDRLDTLIDQKIYSEAVFSVLQSEIDYQVYLLKYHVIYTLDTYCESIFYYQFSECDEEALPQLTDSLDRIQIKIAAIYRNHILYNIDLFRFAKSQPFHLQMNLNDTSKCLRSKKFRTMNNCPVRYFSKNNNIVFNITLDNTVFTGLDRVRIQKVRVYLKGATGSYAKLQIQTSGMFKDRFRGVEYDFAGFNLNRAFEYELDDQETIILDGDIFSEERGYFANTTPFTTWTIRIPPGIDSDIDLTNLNNIEIHFFGNAVQV